MQAISLPPHEVNIWVTNLNISTAKEQQLFLLLNAEEKERARRFHFPLHQKRFIAARSMLRICLGNYLALPAAEIPINYTATKKPYIIHNVRSGVHFNLAHSDDLAVLAVTSAHEIGVDIEKVQATFRESVAQRFFSEEEYQQLNSLPPSEQAAAFYRIWARKEAIVKAIGKGLTYPLSSFTVSIQPEKETLLIENKSWTLLSVNIHPEYQAALASNQIIEEIKIHPFVHS